MLFGRNGFGTARLGRLGVAAAVALLCAGGAVRAGAVGPASPAPSSAAPAAAVPEAAGTEPQDAVLLDRLCAQDLRANEEDRLFGLISLAVRATIGYRHGVFSPALVDNAVQDSLAALLTDCSRIVTAPATHRLGLAIGDIEAATQARMAEPRRPVDAAARAPGTATAADLSEDLSSSEIDAWLDGLPPRERALALFLYASDVTPTEVAGAVGVPLQALAKDNAATKSGLLAFSRERRDGTPHLPAPEPAMGYRIAGTSLVRLLRPGRAADRPAGAVRITGISSDLYAGWSLLAIAVDLPPDKSLDIDSPFILATDNGNKQYLAVAAAEISKPSDPVRRFLLKAYAIDGDHGNAGFHDTLHLAAARVDTPQVLLILHDTRLSNIEIARCLWHEYGKAADPGLCP